MQVRPRVGGRVERSAIARGKKEVGTTSLVHWANGTGYKGVMLAGKGRWRLEKL